MPNAQWIVGRGWIESRWTPAAFPAKADLDAVVADRPVVLQRADGHALIANSAALKRAGIDRNTPNPAGGEILKDAAGEPTGMLVDNAMDILVRLIPPDDRRRARRRRWRSARSAQRARRLDSDCRTPARRSAKSICCASCTRRGRIKLRVYNAIDGPGAGRRSAAERGRVAQSLRRSAHRAHASSCTSTARSARAAQRCSRRTAIRRRAPGC